MSVTEYLKSEDWRDSEPGARYVKLRKRIQSGIHSGVLKPNDTLPAEREIANLTGFSRVTVRRAMEELVKQGIIIQRQGSGSYVAETVPRVEQSLSQLTSFTDHMKRRGQKVETVWLDRGMRLPTPDEIVTLALTSDERVAHIDRLRIADGRPMAIERASLPADILPDPMLVQTSLYEVLQRHGNRPVRAVQKISAIILEADDAEILGVDIGSAGLSIERISYLPNRRAIELTRSVYRGDAYEFVAELRVVGPN